MENLYVCPNCGREQEVITPPGQVQVVEPLCLMPLQTWNRQFVPCTGRLVRKETAIERPHSGGSNDVHRT